MNKRDLRLLEKVFASDIDTERVVPYQSKSKGYERLEKEGYVCKVEMVFPGRFPVVVKGWTLTLLGNFTYCMSCKDEPDEV